MLSQLWSRINQDNIPCHYRADPAWRCETWLYHCCRHYTNPNCWHYWYPDMFGAWDDCEFVTPEAYYFFVTNGPDRVMLPLPPASPPSSPGRSVRLACWRALTGIGRSAVRTARVYYLGREVVERREREAKTCARRRQISEDEELVKRMVELGFLGLGLWRRRLEDEDEEYEGEYEDGTGISEDDDDQDDESDNVDVGQVFLNERKSVMSSVMEVMARDDAEQNSEHFVEEILTL
ncbi:hypothetical protein AYL99_10770 [Fonsecaea erecta]|uniref:Uncharacterized protein n=1 Tax=Fonsecaea erecta TaxID=1367422 RepID=A0A178Z5M5_9EURO|nr:hypothetical protein AYL99_10770 [Fonsecaea erecta]OAP55070.1 hypothetical protein AYL99_10770 [Fonsecaea erecta]